MFALVATAQGLWIGSVTERIGRYEHHGRIAFMPLAGGTEVPESRVGTLPGDLFRLGVDGTLTRGPFTGTTTGPSSTAATGINWSTVRGAFAVNGRRYTGHADGTMTVRSFDGTTAGPATPLALNGLTSTQFPVSRITGMFLMERPPLLHPERRPPPLLPLVYPPERHHRRRHLRRQRRRRRPQLVHGHRHDHGLRPPDLRHHHHRHPVHRRLPQRPPHRPGHRRQRPGRRRSLLAVPRPVRPQPGRLTGPCVRYPALHPPL
jgi:hypothetical protein